MFRSGSPRSLSKPRNTFALYSTPLSRAARPLCPIRHLARCLPGSIDMADTLRQWEAYANETPSHDIRNTWTRLRELYRKEKQNKKNKHLKDVFPSTDDEGINKTLEDFLPEYEAKVTSDDTTDLPMRYPKLLNDSGDFYTQYAHSNTSIMKKRPYESSENSNDGTD